jgi:hypothetical protein
MVLAVSCTLSACVMERIYAPDASNIIHQCSAAPGGTRPDFCVRTPVCGRFNLAGLTGLEALMALYAALWLMQCHVLF